MSNRDNLCILFHGTVHIIINQYLLSSMTTVYQLIFGNYVYYPDKNILYFGNVVQNIGYTGMHIH